MEIYGFGKYYGFGLTLKLFNYYKLYMNDIGFCKILNILWL